MWPYLVLFSLAAWPALVGGDQQTRKAIPKALGWQIFAIFLALFIGFRQEVGGDWFHYTKTVEHFASLDLATVLSDPGNSDPAFALLCWLSAGLGGDYFVNLVCAMLFTAGLIEFCRNQPNPWLALVVAIPYLVIVVAMGYTRQGVAIGIAMPALVALTQGRLLKFIFLISIAATFHKTATILIPLAIFSGIERRWSVFFAVAATGPLAFFLILRESIDRLVEGYIYDGMESSGAIFRVIMNLLPSIVFLIANRKFPMGQAIRTFWVWMSIAAILFVPALILSPSSTVVDRIALYWIPLQIFVWSRVPQALSGGRTSERLLRWTVVLYSFSVIVTWLLLGQHSYAWIPYRFLPWTAITEALILRY